MRLMTHRRLKEKKSDNNMIAQRVSGQLHIEVIFISIRTSGNNFINPFNDNIISPFSSKKGNFNAEAFSFGE